MDPAAHVALQQERDPTELLLLDQARPLAQVGASPRRQLLIEGHLASSLLKGASPSSAHNLFGDSSPPYVFRNPHPPDQRDAGGVEVGGIDLDVERAPPHRTTAPCRCHPGAPV